MAASWSLGRWCSGSARPGSGPGTNGRLDPAQSTKPGAEPWLDDRARQPPQPVDQQRMKLQSGSAQATQLPPSAAVKVTDNSSSLGNQEVAADDVPFPARDFHVGVEPPGGDVSLGEGAGAE